MRSTTPASGSAAVVELVRLAVVVLATAGAYDLSGFLADEQAGSLLTLLGAGAGYVGGGVLGRFAVGRVDAAERRLRQVSAAELLAASLGGVAGLAAAAAVSWPVLLLDNLTYALPLAAIATTVLCATGVRVGRARGGDLLRALGATGRLSVATPAGGSRAKLVDTSALVDGRIVDVCRTGFLEGTLVMPRFVLYELQGLADAGEPERQARGRRGLDVLGALQRSSSIALEVADADLPEIAEVDAKLVALALQRGAALLTVDGNLARVAEVQGVTVLNLHLLAEQLRPPVVPGDRLRVRVVKPGRERGQGIAYLEDGTMVVVEGGRPSQGAEVAVEVTSILSNARGRMVFATALPSGGPTRLVPSVPA